MSRVAHGRGAAVLKKYPEIVLKRGNLTVTIQHLPNILYNLDIK